MKKQLLLIPLLAAFLLTGITQAQTNVPIKKSKKNYSNNLFIDLGGNYSSFQDVKYSDVHYAGAGLNFNIGYNKSNENYFWETALKLNYSTESASTHNLGKAIVVNPTIYFKYLKPIKKNFKVGARLDLLDSYFRKIEELGNNGTYYINGHHLYGSVMHDYKLNDNWNLQSGLDLGLVSFMKESTSFGFSAPQTALEEGGFNYQSESLESPFGYKYFDWKYFGNNLNIKTSFFFQYKNRISLGYSWDMKRFANVKSYPVTTGMHNIIFRYNIIHK